MMARAVGEYKRPKLLAKVGAMFIVGNYRLFIRGNDYTIGMV